MKQEGVVIDKAAAVRIATSIGWEPKREWIGLTDEEIESIAKNYALNNPTTPLYFASAIEAKLKEKNT